MGLRATHSPGLLAGLAAVVSLALAGCGEREPADGRKRVEIWTLALRPFFDDYMNERIRAFESANPDVDAVWVDVPYEALERKLIAAAAARRAPDVVNMPDLSFARFASLGAFADLEPALGPEAAGEYLPGAIAMCRLGGTLLALPWYVNPQALIVNTRLLAEGGLDAATLPGDWRSIAALAPEFHARTGKFLFSQPLGEESQLPIMMLADGLAPFVEEGGRLRARLATPAIESFLGIFVDLYRRGALPREAATRGHAHLTELYQDGRVALINTGPNFVKRIRDVSPSIFEHTAVRPGLVGSLGRVHMPVMVLSVTSQSRHPAEAARLAAFITGSESQLGLCRISAVMPSTRRSLADPFFADIPEGASSDEARLLQARRVAAQTLGDAVAFTPALDCWPDLRRAFDEQMKRVLVGGGELGRALVEIEREWDAILAAAAPATMEAVPRPAPAALDAGGRRP